MRKRRSAKHIYCPNGQTRKNPRRKPPGSVLQIMDHPWGRAARFQPTIRPTEYRCYIKEDVQYATAGAVTPSWNTFLRPPGKLPVPVALNARSPTLFGLTIHHFPGNVKREFDIFLRNCGSSRGCTAAVWDDTGQGRRKMSCGLAGRSARFRGISRGMGTYNRGRFRIQACLKQLTILPRGNFQCSARS